MAARAGRRGGGGARSRPGHTPGSRRRPARAPRATEGRRGPGGGCRGEHQGGSARAEKPAAPRGLNASAATRATPSHPRPGRHRERRRQANTPSHRPAPRCGWPGGGMEGGGDGSSWRQTEVGGRALYGKAQRLFVKDNIANDESPAGYLTRAPAPPTGRPAAGSEHIGLGFVGGLVVRPPEVPSPWPKEYLGISRSVGGRATGMAAEATAKPRPTCAQPLYQSSKGASDQSTLFQVV